MTYELRHYRGGLIYLDVDESHVTAAMARSEYEPRKLEVMERLLKPGMTFVDVGANLGYFTLLAAKLVGPEGRVIAFEPHPDNTRRLRISIAANDYDNVLVCEMAIGHPGTERGLLYLGQQSGQHTLLPGVRPGGLVIDVVQMPLDKALDRADVTTVDMVKVDVEGAEDLVVAFGDWQGMTPPGGLTLLMDLHPELGIQPVSTCLGLHGLGFQLFDHPDMATPLVAGQFNNSLHEIFAQRIVT